MEFCKRRPPSLVPISRWRDRSRRRRVPRAVQVPGPRATACTRVRIGGDSDPTPARHDPNYNAHMARADRLALWMRQHLASSGARGFVVGLSGGVDSAVVVRLAQIAAPGATLGALLPCYSDPQDEHD